MIKNAPDMKVRLSADLREKIKTTARVNNRTMNAEIVARLEQSFREEVRGVSPLPSPDQEERLAKLEKVVIAFLTDERLDAMANRLAALEHRFGEQAP
jgi:hypothetical protein